MTDADILERVVRLVAYKTLRTVQVLLKGVDCSVLRYYINTTAARRAATNRRAT